MADLTPRSAPRSMGPLVMGDERRFPTGRVLFGVLLLAAALVQATFLPALGLLAVGPDLALIFLLIWSATHGVREGLWWAFGLGIWLDLLTLDPLGAHVLPLLVVALIGGAAQGRLFRSGIILPMLAVIGASLASHLVAQLIDVARGEGMAALGLLRLAVTTAFLNALLVPLAWLVLLLVDRFIPRRAR